MNEPILSLCLPTNGVIEWVFPVLDSIYNQNVDLNMFEIIVSALFFFLTILANTVSKLEDR